MITLCDAAQIEPKLFVSFYPGCPNLCHPGVVFLVVSRQNTLNLNTSKCNDSDNVVKNAAQVILTVHILFTINVSCKLSISCQ